jgi:hypothetical protein
LPIFSSLIVRGKAILPACGNRSMMRLVFLISCPMRLNSRNPKRLKEMAAKCSVKEELAKAQHFIFTLPREEEKI